MVLFIGFVLLLAGVLLWVFAIKRGQADLDRDQTERENAERFNRIVFMCGAILGGVGFLLLMLNFILGHLGVSLE